MKVFSNWSHPRVQEPLEKQEFPFNTSGFSPEGGPPKGLLRASQPEDVLEPQEKPTSTEPLQGQPPEGVSEP